MPILTTNYKKPFEAPIIPKDDLHPSLVPQQFVAYGMSALDFPWFVPGRIPSQDVSFLELISRSMNRANKPLSQPTFYFHGEG